jgi:hypothetical protein
MEWNGMLTFDQSFVSTILSLKLSRYLSISKLQMSSKANAAAVRRRAGGPVGRQPITSSVQDIAPPSDQIDVRDIAVIHNRQLVDHEKRIHELETLVRTLSEKMGDAPDGGQAAISDEPIGE